MEAPQTFLRRYDLSKVGRLKLNFKFGLEEPLDGQILTKRDILEVIRYLIDLKNGANISGSHTLIFRAAITGVSTSTEPLKPYEIIPIALVTAAAMTAAGERDKNSELFLEAEFIDASTGKPVLQVVRKGFGKDLEDNKQQVTLDTLKGVIDSVVRDIEQFQ